MSEFNPQPTSIVELRAAYAEHALRPGGVLYGIAENVVAGDVALTPREAGNVLLQPKQPGEASEARWQLIEGATDAVKAGAAEHEEEILNLATQLDMKKPESISHPDVMRIAPTQSLWIIEGGANRTSVVRRELANQTAAAVYGQGPKWVNLYQFGTDRAIPRMRNGQPNAEYKIAIEIAGNVLDLERYQDRFGSELTEFGLNVASALQGGYELVEDRDGGEVAARIVELRKPGVPRLLVMQPHKRTGGLEDAFSTLTDGYKLHLDSAQFVMFTNGQYRPKDEQQADRWARGRGFSMLPPVAIGDEPGFTVEHNGRQITTAERKAMAYLNEAVILERLS
jgi:hypothetical protein